MNGQHNKVIVSEQYYKSLGSKIFSSKLSVMSVYFFALHFCLHILLLANISYNSKQSFVATMQSKREAVSTEEST